MLVSVTIPNVQLKTRRRRSKVPSHPRKCPRRRRRRRNLQRVYTRNRHLQRHHPRRKLSRRLKVQARNRLGRCKGAPLFQYKTNTANGFWRRKNCSTRIGSTLFLRLVERIFRHIHRAPFPERHRCLSIRIHSSMSFAKGRR